MKVKDPAKEANILDEAANIIVNEGAGALTTTKVAKNIGMAQSNIYTYFKDKDVLLNAVYEREMSRLTAVDDFAYLVDSNHSIAERVQFYLSMLYRVSTERPQSLVLIDQIKYLPNKHLPSLASEHGPNQVVFDLMAEGQRVGAVKSLPVGLLLTMVITVMSRQAQLVLASEPFASEEEMLRMLTDALMNQEH